MIRWSSATLVGLLFLVPAFAEQPEPQHDGIELSIWVRNLSAEQRLVQLRAYAAIMALGPAAKPALPAIIEAVKKTRCDESTNLPLAEIVTRIDPSQAGPAVRELVQHMSRQRSNRELAFVKSNGTAVMPHLRAVVKGAEPQVRIEAIRLILELEDKAQDALPELVQVAETTASPAVRFQALDAIGKLDPVRYADLIAPIVAALKEGGIDASRAYDWLRPYADRAIPVLIREFEDPRTTSRLSIADALLRFETTGTPTVVRDLAHDLAAVRRACATALRTDYTQARRAVLQLMLALDDYDAIVRLNCACTLLNIDSKHERAVLPTLTELIGADDPNVRQEAVARLSGLKVDIRSAVPALLGGLDDRDRTVRLRSAELLMRIDKHFGPAIVPALVRSFTQATWTRREERDLRLATTLAAEVGPAALPVLPYLQKFLAMDSRMNRLPYAVAATRISLAVADQTLPVLTEYLSDRYEGEGRSEAVRELGRIGPAAKSTLSRILEVMNSDDSGSRYDAAEAAIRISPDDCERAMSVVRAGLKKKNDRSEALAALRRLGPLARESVPELQALLKSDDKVEREAVEETLRHVTAK